MKEKKCIYPPEIAEYTGLSIAQSRRLLVRIRKYFNMPSSIPVPICMFLKFTKYPPDDIHDYIKKGS